MTLNDWLSFEIYIMDLCEAENPKSCEDLEDFADEIHQRVENAIQDYIRDDDDLDVLDYDPRY